MIASDEKFLEVQKKNQKLLPENEQGFLRAGKLERIFSAIGGAIVTFATTRAINNDENKNWIHYTLAVIGGALVLRGTLGPGKNSTKIENEDF
jgi:hypothetical protein